MFFVVESTDFLIDYTVAQLRYFAVHMIALEESGYGSCAKIICTSADPYTNLVENILEVCYNRLKRHCLDIGVHAE